MMTGFKIQIAVNLVFVAGCLKSQICTGIGVNDQCKAQNPDESEGDKRERERALVSRIYSS